MDEIVFLHLPRPQSSPTLSRHSVISFYEKIGVGGASLNGLTQDKDCAPLEWRLSFINRAPARRAREKVLSWNCQRIIGAHGEWVCADGHAFLAKSFRWLAA
jgi:hypothetical protein